MRPWITEPYRRVPGELFSAVGHGEIDADKRPGRLKTGHEELFSRRVVEFYPGEGASSALMRIRSAPVSSRHSIGAAGSPSRAMSTTGRGVSSPPLAAGSARNGNLIAVPRR